MLLFLCYEKNDFVPPTEIWDGFQKLHVIVSLVPTNSKAWGRLTISFSLPYSSFSYPERGSCRSLYVACPAHALIHGISTCPGRKAARGVADHPPPPPHLKFCFNEFQLPTVNRGVESIKWKVLEINNSSTLSNFCYNISS